MALKFNRLNDHPDKLIDAILDRIASGETQKKIYADLIEQGLIVVTFRTFERAIAEARKQNRVRDMLENRNRTMPQIAPQHQFAVSNKSEDEFDIEKMWNGQ